MPDLKLNLAALRRRSLPGRPLDSERGFSRRELFGAASVTAAALSPAVRALGDSLQGPFQLKEEGGRAIFEYAGENRWVIDPADYSGKPELLVEKEDRSINVTLRGATYPGTDIPADFSCELRAGLSGWKMKLRHALGGFKGQAPFERWLLGQAALESPVRLDTEVCSLGGEAPVKLTGRAHAEFRPDGGFHFRGEGLAQVTGETPLASDTAHLQLLRRDDPSLFEDAGTSRTLVSLKRGSRIWPLKPVVEDLPAGELSWDYQPFDTLRVEVAPSTDGPRAVMLAEAGENSALAYKPHEKLLGHDDTPFELRLRNARYAVSFDPEGPRTALVADFDRPSWMYADGCSVLVGHGPNATPFEVAGRGGKAESLTCAPALLGFMAPLPGAIVEPSLLPEGETITFEAEQNRLQRPPAIATQINKAQLNPLFAHIGIMRGGRIRVVRPEDMLTLEFELINLRFQAGGGAPTLVRSNPQQAAYLVVHFPPQHITEEAGYEQAGSTGTNVVTPPPVWPARTRMAGPSRLAFLVPNSVASIPYTLEGLLAWEKLVPSVVPGADPPPAPLRLPTGAFTLPANDRIGRMSAEIDDDSIKRLSKSANQVRSRGLDLNTVSLVRPKITLLSPTVIPQVQAAPKPGAATVSPTVTAKPPISIIALLEDKSVREPHPFETAIEAPWRLILSPHDLSGWKHESDLDKVTHNGRTELWHTRLGTLRNGKVDEDDEYYRAVRAVWSPDYQDAIQNPADIPFRTSLQARHRNQIVWQSAEWRKHKDPNGKTVTPKVIPAEQFMLTPLGASVDLHGKWDSTNMINLEQWVHKAQLGRDNFVRVDEAGYLMPFGHRAILVVITERKFFVSEGQRFALLLQRKFVEVKEPEKTYPSAGMRDSGNRFPFVNVTIKTKRTPDMADPGSQVQFFPVVAGADFNFHLVATDRTGRDAEYSMPLQFVFRNIAHQPPGADGIPGVVKVYNAASVGRRRPPFDGQKIGFAPSAVPGDTVLDTAAILFKADRLNAVDPNRAPFAPCMATADVSVPAARAIADASGNINVEYPAIYYNNGFGGANARGQIYLRLTAKPDSLPQLRYDAGGKGDRAGGMASPNVKISAISRKNGVVGGTIDGIGGSERDLPVAGQRGADAGSPWQFKPKEFFGDAAKLLGFLALKEIIPDDPIGDGKDTPKLTFKDEETKITTTLEWNPDLKNPVLPAPLDKLFVPYAETLNKTTNKYENVLNIKAVLVTFLSAQDPTYDILGQANKFTMDIFDSIELKFDYVKFTAKSGAGVDVDPKFGKDWIVFKGPLSFVNKLKDLLGGGGSDRALTRFGGSVGDLFHYFVDPSPSGIRAGFTVSVPSVAVGVFSLQNIAVGAEVSIPFTGDPFEMKFNFCSRENQFLLTVWIFGGGGFFNLTVGLDGIVGFEAGFQFGVAASISFGIASGGVSVMAGFTYDYERVKTGTNLAGADTFDGKSTLVGYFEANGWVDVLGLISASLELYLGLEYTSQGGNSELWGTARITFKIEILFLSFEVSAEVEKRFAGSGPSSRGLPVAGGRAAVTSAMGGVKFEEIYSESEWNEYCLAFA